MRPIEKIRKNVFGATQAEFARIAGVVQATVSRWESGESSPTLEQLELISAEAIARGLDWDSDWFFQPSDGGSREAEASSEIAQ